MKRLIAAVHFVLVSASPGMAEETLHQTTWDALRDQVGRAGATVLAADESASFARLRIENLTERHASTTVLTLDRPPITSARYAVVGMVRYEAVRGPGFLEMWSVFPDGGQYFSRTLGSSGPLQSLAGSSDWRRFVLPFFNQEGGPPPSRLIVNVVLPGPGRVDLAPLRLVQYGPGDDPLAGAAQWWSEKTGAWVGAILGSMAGILGGVIGWLAGKGKARRIVLGLTRAAMGLGFVALVLGLVAVGRGQPYAVFYPLLLIGVLCAALGSLLLRPLRRRYEAHELRRMRAVDAG